MGEHSQHDPDQEPAGNYVEAVRRGVPFRDAAGSVQYPTMRSRPHRNFGLDPFHCYLLLSSLIVAVAYTAWMLARIPSLPDQMPMQFAGDGSVNRYGSPVEMVILAGILLTTIIGCAVLVWYPRIYNYGVKKVTAENIQDHYRNGMQMMVWMVFGLATIQVISLGGVVGDWPISPAIWGGLALVLGSTSFFIARMIKL